MTENQFFLLSLLWGTVGAICVADGVSHLRYASEGGIFNIVSGVATLGLGLLVTYTNIEAICIETVRHN